MTMMADASEPAAPAPAPAPAPLEADGNAVSIPGDENVGSILKIESTKLADLKESRAELLARVQSLKKDLQEWRGKLDSQVSNYRQELGDLRNTLNVEVDQLKTEFQDLRESLKKQLDATSNLRKPTPEKQFGPQQSTETTQVSPRQTQDTI